MLTLIFVILMLTVFGKVFVFGLKASWGIFKFLIWLLFLPLTLVFMVLGGLITIAIPVLVVIGIVTLVKSASVANNY